MLSMVRGGLSVRPAGGALLVTWLSAGFILSIPSSSGCSAAAPLPPAAAAGSAESRGNSGAS